MFMLANWFEVMPFTYFIGRYHIIWIINLYTIWKQTLFKDKVAIPTAGGATERERRDRERGRERELHTSIPSQDSPAASPSSQSCASCRLPSRVRTAGNRTEQRGCAQGGRHAYGDQTSWQTVRGLCTNRSIMRTEQAAAHRDLQHGRGRRAQAKWVRCNLGNIKEGPVGGRHKADGVCVAAEVLSFSWKLF